MGSLDRNIKDSISDFINVKNFGAIGDGFYDSSPATGPARYVPGNTDDTAAFKAAIDAAKIGGLAGSVYVPSGVYKITEPLTLDGIMLEGQGANTVLIACNGASNWTPNNALIYAGGQSKLANIMLQYDFDIAAIQSSATAEACKYVLVKCYCVRDGSIFMLARGSSIRNVYTSYCWTAFGDVPSVGLPFDEASKYSVFSTTFDTIECINFAYAGFDFQSTTRTGNVYSNIYIGNNELGAPTPYLYTPKAGFSLQGAESESVIHQLNIEHATFTDAAVIFAQCTGISASTIHLEGIDTASINKSYIRWQKSVGVIGTLSIYYTRMSFDGTNIINFESSTAYLNVDFFNRNTANSCVIDNMYLCGVAAPNTAYSTYPANRTGWYKITNSFILSRSNTYSTEGPLYVDVNQYTWNAPSYLGANEENKYLSRATATTGNLVASWDKQSNDETISNNLFATLFMKPLAVTGPAANPTFTDIPNPAVGQIAYANTNKLYVWIGSKWKVL